MASRQQWWFIKTVTIALAPNILLAANNLLLQHLDNRFQVTAQKTNFPPRIGFQQMN
jgi:hypothetical protein